jgi:hypothetical protein
VTHTVDVSYRNFETIAEMEKWCKENLYHGGYYEPKWCYHNNQFIFEDEQEYIWFKLRWE